ncbi:MAG: exonuclease SbcCD subunit D [Geoalkalibacter sp.]|jgi:DNA repair exonuclease SbcCD nuclease subunit|uniref:metallophosphoesterase family protein n=1 Tax=Geoalkalibacter sp. TaxID=3041440 RepID=UPI002A998DB1|nr:DNA repair exonuclease [Thermodesulfobacteriota bacterium]
MFKFLHAADLHLDSPLRGLETYPDAPVEQIRGATRRALENLIDLAIEERVAFVLLAGDIYDGDWKDYNTGLFFSRCMGRLREAGIGVFLISGNHDAASVVARNLSPPDNVRVFSTRHAETHFLPDLCVAVHGQGYAVRDVREDLTRAYPEPEPGMFNIGLLHTVLSGRPGHESYAPTTLDHLRGKGYDYWALGHVHQHEVVCDDPWVVFPGALQGRHIRETGPKGCTLVAVEEGRVASVEQRELDVFRWFENEVCLEGCEASEDLLYRVRESLEKAREQADGRPVAVRLTLSGSSAMHEHLHREKFYWIEECRNLAVGLGDIWLENVILRTRPERDPATELESGSSLDELVQAVGASELTPELFEEIPEIAELRAKMPPELADAFVFDQDSFDLFRDEIRDLLRARLMGEESPS